MRSETNDSSTPATGSPEAAAMIRTLFVSMQELNKGARRPVKIPARALQKIGVIGAGFMGAGIAYVTAQAGMDVVLIDRDQASADKGKEYSNKLISGQIMKGRAKSADRDALLGRISATDDYAALKGAAVGLPAVLGQPKTPLATSIRSIARKIAGLPNQRSSAARWPGWLPQVALASLHASST